MVAKVSFNTEFEEEINSQMIADTVSTCFNYFSNLDCIRFDADETNLDETHTHTHTHCTSFCQELLPPLRGVGSAALEFFDVFFAQSRLCCGGDCLPFLGHQAAFFM